MRSLKVKLLGGHTYLELRLSSFLDVTVHVDFIVKGGVVLDDEALKGCVLVAVQLLHQIHRRRLRLFFVRGDQRSLVLESYGHILHR